MSIASYDSTLIAKTRELCSEIVSDPSYLQLLEKVERFLNDDASRLQYQSVHERGEELHHKQHAGIQLGAEEIREFESAREALFANEIATNFIEAQRELEQLQKVIGRYVSMTLELGRVPSAEDIEASSSGCCGGGGAGGGCGCSH
ncbi:MAG: YlbF family regulator [Verrucomicrobia bacterium]|nr:YlbF family regulator [Verrucomicrobiota bacterium]